MVSSASGSIANVVAVGKLPLACPGLRSAVAIEDVSAKVAKLEAEIRQWETNIARRIPQKGLTRAAITSTGEYDLAKAFHHEATMAAQPAQNEMRRSGGALQLVGEDVAQEIVKKGATRLIIFQGMSQNTLNPNLNP